VLEAVVFGDCSSYKIDYNRFYDLFVGENQSGPFSTSGECVKIHAVEETFSS